MKKGLLLLMTLIVSICSYAASDFLVDGRTWNYKMKDAFVDENYKPVLATRYFSLKIEGDTIFQGVDCKKIYFTENDSTYLFAYAYEENLTAYFYFLKSMKYFCAASDTWVKGFDFNLKIGDKYTTDEYIGDIDTIEVKGTKYTRFWIGLKENGKIGLHEPMIYSIGGTDRFWAPSSIFSPSGFPQYASLSVYDGDKCIFESSDYRKAPISTDNEDVTTDKKSAFMVDGRSWKYYYYHRTYDADYIEKVKKCYYSLTIQGDTIISDRCCKKIYYKEDSIRYNTYDKNYNLTETHLVISDSISLHGFICEEKGSVSFYFLNKLIAAAYIDLGKWIKMYDFNAKSGEQCDWLIYEHGFSQLTKTQENINGIDYPCYLLYGENSQYGNVTVPVIPGIGCNGLYFTPIELSSSTFGGGFLSVYDGKKSIFKSSDYYRLFDKYNTKYAAVRLGTESMESQFDYDQNHVTHLWVWGKPQAADYEYLRTKRLAELELLDMRDADVDTIPTKAFYTTISNKKRIILPATLKHLDDSALCVTYPQYSAPGEYDLTFELSCPTYPTLGKDVYVEKKDFYDLAAMPIIVPSADNKAFRCNSNNADGILYSEDGTTAYYSNGNSIIADGTRIINGAFMENGFFLSKIILPATLDSIGDRAFANVIYLEDTGYYVETMTCYAPNPPKLGKDVFLNSMIYNIPVYVPSKSYDIYKNTEVWKDFDLRRLVDDGIEDITTDKKSAFLVEGRSWNYKQTTFDIKANDIVEKFFSLTIKGETIFRDVPCREIYHTENGKSSLYGYAYEDGAKVYFYFLKDIENLCSPSTDWELIFDFDKKETEIFNTSFPAYLVAKDTIEVKGNTYQRYWIGPKLEPKFKSEIIKFYPIVHSIGGYAGLHNNTFERTGKSPSYSCESVYDGDECIFEKKDFCADAINSEYDKYLKGKRWNYSYSSYMQVFGDNKKNFSLSRHHPYSLTINGDTVVSGRSCKKIYYINKYTKYIFQLNEVSSDTLFVPNNDVVLHGYIHETKDSVSFYIEKEIFGVESPEANGQWCKMYDFTAPSGTYCDWLEELSEPGFYMLGKEDVVIGGQTYTAYLLYGDKTSSLQGTIVVIPGIGCDGLYFSTPRLGTSTFSLYFSSVYDGDNCLWNSKNQNELFDKYFGKYAAVRLGSEPMESQFDYNHNHVTHLWVWGKPQAADYEYLRTKRLAELELLDMRDADIDTLQAEAFDITLSESNASPKYIVLPKKLKHISDNALCVYPNITTYEVTGAYPSLGKDVYSRKGKTSNHIFVVPSIDNKYLTLHTIDPTGGSSGPGRVPIKRLAMVDNDSIYGSSVMSKGGDTLYYVNASKGKGYAVANGMKTIAANAMENKLLENAFNIPETVDSIGNRAFNGLRIVETRSNTLQYYLACYRANPPMIGNEVFDESSLVTGSHVFYVNKESISDYKNTKGWDKLYYGDIDDVSGIEEVKTAKEQSPYYYDLQGRRLINPTKGLYIHNGKKVIVR